MNKPSPLIGLPLVHQPTKEAVTAFVEVSLSTYPKLDQTGTDWLAHEEPLEISLEYSNGSERIRKPISITMRTPGEDLELATGFLIGEGIISSSQQVADHHLGANRVLLRLSAGHQPDVARLDRHFYTSSSCGVCGKATLEAISTVCQQSLPHDGFQISPEQLIRWPNMLRKAQPTFDRTGGLHAAGLFDASGRLEFVREDVGRHNAVDKVIGSACLAGRLPLANSALLVSGRASFELVQKALMAGIPLLAAVGAPSSLAVELAKRYDMTLIGFVRNDRFNVYHGAWRLSTPVSMSD
ncbi:formate dehydrogenase accessory sulfurtransferase FdhD [Zavarzinella formosa]|uniref:formate dehydrogenase accessory sulfurtransferase FdhD n=1 Tax=Zavarzinella formosa TaxID=360055 RepID=UPI00030F53D1|nr:formate dehydrogenase accessory sulfurtransferase FdhD [Zavarzinella formosa]